MTKLEQWIVSIILSLIISLFFTFLILYKTDIKEWWAIGLISFVTGMLLIKIILFLMEETNND